VAWLVYEPGHEEFGKIIACSAATGLTPSQSSLIVPSTPFELSPYRQLDVGL